MSKLKSAGLAVLLCALGATGALAAQRTYEVTVTNVTNGQTFTPILVVSHRPGVRLFELGQPGRPGAGGDRRGGLLGPGETVVIPIMAKGQFRRLSLAGMLIPTNDPFVALNGVALPTG